VWTIASVSRIIRRSLATLAALACVGTASTIALRAHDRDSAATAPTFSVVAGGDVLIHPELTAQARKDARAEGKKGLDFGPLMAGLKPVISQADLAICHLETVVAEPDGPYLGYRKFAVPPQIIPTLKDVGYDTCSTASNHTLDHGYAGVKRTLDDLDKAGIKHAGSYRSAADARRFDIIDVHGIKVCQLSYAYGFNDTTVPKDKPWLANRISVPRIERDARAAHRAGADVVITSLHWGIEQHNEPSAGQVRIAHELAKDKDINLIIGHHAHVVEPFEKIDGTWVVYGMGNQVARHLHPDGLTEEGVMAWFRFTELHGTWRVTEANFIPTYVDLDEKNIRVYDVASALDSGAVPAKERPRFRLAFHRTEGIVLNRGGAAAGLKPLQDIDG
jgi:poly-gamma-glutamate synthesis protein (capsule biosynthesis protein)